MRILVLEDNEERRKHFKRGLIGHVGVIVDTAQDAIKALQEEIFDAVFLDHDLYQQAYVPSGPGTGYEVAEWLSKNKDRMPARVYIHSFNEKGRDKMLEVLPEAVKAEMAWSHLSDYLEKESDGGSKVENVSGLTMHGNLWIPKV